MSENTTQDLYKVNVIPGVILEKTEMYAIKSYEGTALPQVGMEFGGDVSMSYEQNVGRELLALKGTAAGAEITHISPMNGLKKVWTAAVFGYNAFRAAVKGETKNTGIAPEAFDAVNKGKIEYDAALANFYGRIREPTETLVGRSHQRVEVDAKGVTVISSIEDTLN